MSDPTNQNQTSSAGGNMNMNPNVPLKPQNEVAFYSADTPQSKDIFTGQNVADEKKKAESEARKKQVLRIMLMVGMAIAAVFLISLFVFLIVKIMNPSKLTDPSGNEYNDPIGVVEAEKILNNGGSMAEVKAFFDKAIEKEKNVQEKGALVVMAINFYYLSTSDMTGGDDGTQYLIETANMIDPAVLDQMQLAEYIGMMYNAASSAEEAEKWLNYFNERYPDQITTGEDGENGGESEE